MQEVTFNGLCLKFKISNIALKIFNIEIYWYAIIIILAVIISIELYKKNDGMYNIKFNTVLDLLIWAIPIGFLGARIYYCVFNIQYYSNNMQEVFNIRKGGLALYGGIIFAYIFIYIFCKKRKVNLKDMLDFLVINLPLAQSIGRWGNFFNIEAYGRETNNILRMGIIENGVYKEVHPTFLYESICTFIIFLILNRMKEKRKYRGQMVYWYLLLYSIIRYIIEGLRVDSLMMYNFRVSQIFSVVMFAIGLVGVCEKMP